MDIRRRRGSTRSEVDSDASDRSRDSSRRRRRVRKNVAAKRAGSSRPVRGQRRPRVSRSSGQARVARQPARRVARAQPQPESDYSEEEGNSSVASSRASRRAPARRRAAPRRIAPRRASSSRSGESSTGRRRRAIVRRAANSNSSRRGRRGRAPVRSVRSVPRDAGIQQYYPNASPVPSRRAAPRSNLRFREPVPADSMESNLSTPVQPFNPSGFSTPLQVNRNRRVEFGALPSPAATPSSARRGRITGRERTPCPTSAGRQARHQLNRLGSVDYYQPQALFDESSGDEDVFEQENSSFFRTPPTREALRIRARERTPMPTSAGRQARHRYPRTRSTSESDEDFPPQELFPAGPQPARRRKAAPTPAPDVAVEGSSSDEGGPAVNNVVHAGSTPNQSFQYNQSDDEENLLPVGGPNPQ